MEHEFFREIDFPEALELIAEKFDNAVDLIGSDAVVYGGALRDLVAGFPLTSDLDIACNYDEYRQVVRRFDNSEKWTTRRKLRKSISKNLLNDSFVDFGQRKNPYDKIPISSVTNFYTYNDIKVQLMRATPASDGIGSAVDIVKNVDIVCCGLMMDAAGRIFEVIKGAYNDCTDRVLNLNEENPKVDIEALENRINKLEKRGWISKINMRKLVRNAKKLEESRNRHMQKMMEERKKAVKLGGLLRSETSNDAARRAISCRWVSFVKNKNDFVVRVYRKPLNAYIGLDLPTKHFVELMHTAQTSCKLSGDTRVRHDYIEKVFPIRKMSSHYQIETYETRLRDLVEEYRNKVIFSGKVGKIQLEKKRKVRKREFDSAEVLLGKTPSNPCTLDHVYAEIGKHEKLKRGEVETEEEKVKREALPNKKKSVFPLDDLEIQSE